MTISGPLNSTFQGQLKATWRSPEGQNTTHMVSVSPVEGDDVEVEERGLSDDDCDGGHAEEAVVKDLAIAEGWRGEVVENPD